MDESRYLGHFMTAGCRDNEDVVKQFRRKNTVDNMLLSSESSNLHLWRQKIQLFSHIVTQFTDVLSGVIHTRTLLENVYCQF